MKDRNRKDEKGKSAPEVDASRDIENGGARSTGDTFSGDAAGELRAITREDLEKRVLEQEKKLGEEERKAGEYLDDLQRLKAEFENYRKRMVREQTRIIDQASRSLVEKLLTVIDNLEMALESARDRDDKLAEGVRMVYEQLMKTLEQEGLEEINPQGHPFDPEECEAVLAVVSDDHEDETVVEVHQKGYRYKGNLLRPARATVSKCS
ncbi:MAG: nucleotide exchange factor GrpE [Actinomycetota bacterium]|nr:nucleotide exchange factor GrpE [Actinomycetota bacterium]